MDIIIFFALYPGIPGARDRDDELTRARAALNWERHFELSFDPDTARAYHDEDLDVDLEEVTSSAGTDGIGDGQVHGDHHVPLTRLISSALRYTEPGWPPVAAQTAAAPPGDRWRQEPGEDCRHQECQKWQSDTQADRRE